MKRIFAQLAFLAFLPLMISCGGSSNSDSVIDSTNLQGTWKWEKIEGAGYNIPLMIRISGKFYEVQHTSGRFSADAGCPSEFKLEGKRLSAPSVKVKNACSNGGIDADVESVDGTTLVLRINTLKLTYKKVI